MKSIILLLGLVSTIYPTSNLQLTIKISNIEKIQGEIKVGVFNTDTHFLKEGKVFKGYSVKVDKNTASFTISDLPKGEYAVSIYHDVNSDDKMNTNMIGIPKEPYGFSNNVKPIMSAPKFRECKFNFDENTTLNIKLIK